MMPEPPRARDLARDQVLRDGGEVVVDHLPMRLETRLVPRRTELAAAANVRQHEHAAVLEPQLADGSGVGRRRTRPRTRRTRSAPSGWSRRASSPSGARRSTAPWFRPSTSPRAARPCRATRRIAPRSVLATAIVAACASASHTLLGVRKPATFRSASVPCSSRRRSKTARLSGRGSGSRVHVPFAARVKTNARPRTFSYTRGDEPVARRRGPVHRLARPGLEHGHRRRDASDWPRPSPRRTTRASRYECASRRRSMPRTASRSTVRPPWRRVAT